jgi:ABC-type Na+ efflux pump permease subunit
MSKRVATIARYTILEAVRTRLPLLTVVLVCVLVAVSFFVREIAIIESARFQTAFYAATVRCASVVLVALYAISSIVREFQDKGLEVILALDLPRPHYILGKLGGLLVIGLMIALAVSIPLLPFAGWQASALWALSLGFELAVVSALSVFCVVTFNQLLPAFAFVAAFYLFARVITAMRLISGNPVVDATALSHRVVSWLIEALALVTPAFDAWTRTAWLLERPASWTTMISIGAHSVLFVVVFAAAAIFDMYRRNL